jgi:hypothetical protein
MTVHEPTRSGQLEFGAVGQTLECLILRPGLFDQDVAQVDRLARSDGFFPVRLYVANRSAAT